MRRFLALAWVVFSHAAVAQPFVTDDTGRDVRLDRPAQRIVTLAPHATELILALGVGKRLVGHVPTAPSKALPGVPRLTGHGQLDREFLLSMQPDLVVTWYSGNRPADLAWLQKQPFAVFHSEPPGLDGIAANLQSLGVLTGRASQGRAAAEAFRQALAYACRPTGQRVSAYVALWDNPPMTIGGRHWLNEVLSRAGLRNHFRATDRAILRIEPEARLLAGNLTEIRGYPAPSGKTGAIVVDTLGRPGPKVVEVVQQLCRSGTANQ